MLYRDIIQIPEVIEYGRKQREEGKKAGKEEDVRNMAAMGIPKTKISRISGFSMERVSSVLQTEAAPDPPDWVRIADYAEVSPDFAVSSYGTVQ